MLKRRKISIIGSGHTGAMTAYMIASQALGDVVMLDVPEKEAVVRGIALDMRQALPVLSKDVSITGTDDYAMTKNSDLIIITAGKARTPGMSREDLILVNTKIMEIVVQKVVKESPNAILIVLTNPVDVMTQVALAISGFPRNRVMGQSGILDSARFCSFIAENLNVSVQDVSSIVLGGHGDKMVPLIRYTYVGGIPLQEWMPYPRIQKLVERTRKGGEEIVRLLGTGSAYYAPAGSLTEMAKAILLDEHRVLPAIVELHGEYGYEGICFGVPCVLSGIGIEKVIELKLTEDEKNQLTESAESIITMLHQL